MWKTGFSPDSKGRKYMIEYLRVFKKPRMDCIRFLVHCDKKILQKLFNVMRLSRCKCDRGKAYQIIQNLPYYVCGGCDKYVPYDNRNPLLEFVKLS